jgi:hypothetical protein
MSGLNITPGTEFMLAVRRACEYFAASRVAGSYRFKDIAFYISGADVAGEGEVRFYYYYFLLLLSAVSKTLPSTSLFLSLSLSRSGQKHRLVAHLELPQPLS